MLWPNGSGVPQASHSSQNTPIPATVWNVLCFSRKWTLVAR
jgi:hypothetical protein